jgi:hypothetical protein
MPSGVPGEAYTTLESTFPEAQGQFGASVSTAQDVNNDT